MVAGVEVLTEKMFDGLAGIYGKGAADEVVDQVIGKLAKTTAGKNALRILASMGGEAAEEIVSGVVDPALESIYNGKNARENYSASTAADVLHDAIIGGLLGLFGGMGHVGQSAVNVARGGVTRGKTSSANSANAESTAVNTNPEGHTALEQKNIIEYQKSVDKGLVAFINKVRSLKNPDYRNRVRYPISEVTIRQAEAIKTTAGVDATGFKNIITGGAIDHIEHRHGLKGRADHSMADINDVARIQYVLENFDKAELLLNPDGTPSVSDVWKNRDGTPAQRVIFTKKVDGTYYAAIATPDSNAKILAVESAFMSKDKGSTGTVLNMENISPQVTPETPQRANASDINDTLAQPFDVVKPSSQASYADALRRLMAEGKVLSPEQRAILEEWNKRFPEMRMDDDEFLKR